MKHFFSIVSIVVIGYCLNAQNVLPCYKHGTVYEGLIYNSSSIKFNNHLFKRNETIQIPVVIHVIHDGIDTPLPLLVEDNVPEENIYRQLEQLNKDFNDLNEDRRNRNALFAPIATNTKIEFVLAEKDPSGNETNGINRVFYPGLSHTGLVTNVEIETFIKPSTIWDPTKYLNIWTVHFTETTNAFTLLGYAQFPDSSGLAGMPSDESSQNPKTDGVVVNPVVFGVPPEEDIYQNNNRTLTHELGHFFGLRHIWGDGSCDFDDFVEDTPTQESATGGCELERSSCGSQNNTENYMDYTNGNCQNMFTNGQKLRMDQVLIRSPRRRELIFSDVIDRSNTSIAERSIASIEMKSFENFIELRSNEVIEVKEIRIYSTLGLLFPVEHSIYNDKLININTQSLSPGIYILSYKGKSLKFIKP